MLNQIIRLGISTLRSPKTAAADLLAAGIDRNTRYLLAALVIVLGGLVSQLIFGLSTSETDMPEVQNWLATPFGTVALEAALLAVVVLATVLVGRAFGGTGNAEDALLLFSWLQVVSITVQLALYFATSLLDGLSSGSGSLLGVTGILTIGVVCYLFWVFVNFVTVLHSFESALKVMFGTIATMLAIAFGITSLAVVLIGS